MAKMPEPGSPGWSAAGWWSSLLGWAKYAADAVGWGLGPVNELMARFPGLDRATAGDIVSDAHAGALAAGRLDTESPDEIHSSGGVPISPHPSMWAESGGEMYRFEATGIVRCGSDIRTYTVTAYFPDGTDSFTIREAMMDQMFAVYSSSPKQECEVPTISDDEFTFDFFHALH